jgi:hypothetical protein
MTIGPAKIYIFNSGATLLVRDLEYDALQSVVDYMSEKNNGIREIREADPLRARTNPHINHAKVERQLLNAVSQRIQVAQRLAEKHASERDRILLVAAARALAFERARADELQLEAQAS